jgi:glycosyltransferase involved in cell wall biosynthesis
MKIVHIITGLNNGGAESSLFKICNYDQLNKHIVISLMGKGKYGPKLTKLGIKVYCLNIKKNFFLIFDIFYLARLLCSLKPDVVQTWMYHADLLGSVASRLIGIKNIVWNIRQSDLSKNKSKYSTIWIVKILSKFSWLLPKKIVVCSKRAISIHKDLGYCSKKMFFIPNGYDLSIFKPINNKEFTIRKKLRIKKKTPLIGSIGRFDPQKDHMNLLYALSSLLSQNIDFYCILAGPNMNNSNKILTREIQKLKLNSNIKLLGRVTNIPKIMSELDIHILPSEYGEGFPNVVAEAMACNTPCVVTNVGDSALILGKTGWVVPPKNPDRLAKAIKISLSELRTNRWLSRCNKARKRIKKNFHIYKMIKSYRKLWNELC